MKKITLLALCFLAVLATSAHSSVTDAPHNETNDVACGSCHTYSLWWKYSPSSQDEVLGHGAIVNAVCMTCHDTAGPAPFVKGHSSEAMGVTSAYHGGTWGVGCTDCHNPHYQDQLDWRPASFLVEGVIDDNLTSGTTVNGLTPGAGTTTIAISSLTKEEPLNWPAANWSELILALDTDLSSNTYIVLSATATEIVVKGVIPPEMVKPGVDPDGPGPLPANPATANTFGLLYGQLIKSEITVPYTDPNLPANKKAVKFFDPNGGFVDTTNYDGICQVCHTEVLHYRNDNSSPGLTHTNRDSTNCVNCHAHDAGFKGNGHDGTHFTWASVGTVNCAACHIDGGNGIVDGLHGRSCGLCHVSAGGGGPLTIGSTDSGVDGDATGENKNTFDSSCADCHDKSNKPSVNTVPDAHHLASLNSYAIDGDCTQCHADESGKLAADHSAFVADNIPNGTLSSCATAGCHGANVGLTTGAPINPSVGTIHDACITCHETDGSLKAAYGRAPVMSVGANQCSDCHTDKLGAHVIDHVAAGYFYLPVSGNCDTCHDATVDMNIFVDPTNNAVHDGCSTCHDTTDYSLRTDAGRILAPGDCTSCHSDKDDGVTLNLFAHQIDHAQTNRVILHDDCAGCHDATVESVFADAANNKKHDSCETCHVSAADLGLNQNAIAAVGGGNCTTCHGDYFPNHTTITHDVSMRPIDLSAGAPCSSCHRSDADNNGTDLSSWDDIRELHDRDGSGPATACTTCHDSTSQVVLDIIAAGGTPGEIGCLSCHANNANDHGDHKVMGVITAFGGCVSCHDRGNVASSTYYIGTIHKGDCGSCHTNPATGDYTLTGSATGHGQDVVGFDPLTNPNTCTTCHGTDALSVHAATVGSHDGQVMHTIDNSCDRCHRLDDNNNVQDVVHSVHKGDCGSCHDTGDSYALWSVAANGPGNCQDCHGADWLGIHPLTINHATSVSLATDCAGCHSGAAGSASGIPLDNADNTIHDACATCHDASGALKGIAAGNTNPNDCTDCHGDYLPNHQNISHATKVALATECSGCHDGTQGDSAGIPIDPNNNKVHDSCSTCHGTDGALIGSAAGNIDPNTCIDCHGNYFPNHQTIDHATKVALATECSGCHGGTEGNATGIPLDATDNKVHDACTTCHDAVTGGLTGIAIGNTDPNTCTSCHGDYFNNHQSIGHQTKVSLATECASCHIGTEGNSSGIPTDANNSKLHNDCNSCHDAATGGLTSLAIGNPDPNSCANCHGTMILGIHAGSADSHVGQVMFTTDTTCESCHEMDDNNIVQDAIDDVHGGNCGYCHETGNNYALKSLATNGPGTCQDCHGAEWLSIHPTTINHATRVSMASDCAGCHNGAQGSVNGIPVDPNNNKVHDSCSTCHDASGALRGIAAGNSDPNNCVDCHGDYVLQHQNISHATKVGMADECSGCHNGTQGNSGGIPLDPSNNKVHDSCGTCHGNDGSLIGIAAGKTDPNTCTDCHGDYFANHNSISHTAKVGMATECSGCHNGAQGNSSGIPTDISNDKIHDSCSTCHDATGALSGLASGNFDPNTCTDCHGDYFLNHNSIGHTTKVSMATECSGCHDGAQGNSTGIPTSTTNNKVHDSCSTCHSATGALTGIAVGNTDPNNCTDCHGNYFPNHESISHETKVAANIGCDNCHSGTAGTATGIPTDPNDNMVHDSCSTCHGTNGALISIAAGNTGDNVCNDCHGSGTAAAHHGGSTAKGGNCQECHVDRRPWAEAPTQAACRECHVNSSGYVDISNGYTSNPPSHAVNTNGSIQDFGACFACHVVNPYHGKPATATYRDNIKGKGSFNLFYDEFHRPEEYYENTSEEDWYKDNVKDNQYRYRYPSISFNWATLTLDTGTFSVPSFDSQNVTMTIPSHSRIQAAAGCSDCHTVSNIITSTHNNNCQGCHFSSRPEVQNTVASGIAGNNVDCYMCHITSNGGHVPETDHNMLSADLTICTTCHTGEVDTWDGIYALHRSDCLTCHGSTTQMVQDTIDAGKAGNAVGCSDCHGSGSGLGGAHHGGSDAKAGNCTVCHADRRPWADAPTQAACRECHINSSGYVDTSNGYTNNPPSHAWNTNGDIQDFGACFACHTVEPFHAKPTSSPRDCRDSRDYPGRGSFNLFYDELNAEPRDEGNNESCKNDRGDYDRPSISYRMATLTLDTGTFSVPSFDSQNVTMTTPSHSRIQAAVGCSDCHTVSNIITATHNNDCQGCHFSSRPEVQNTVASGIAGNNVDCAMCHITSDGGHVPETDHDMLSADLTICTTCHTGEVNSWDGIYALHRSDCQACHGSATQAVQDTIDAGKLGTPVSCSDCHGSGLATAHHGGSDAKAGNCTACHADPRPDIWSGAPTGQMACRECHINSSGYVDTSNGYTNNPPSHAWNTNGDIQDFGACFACHSPNPYHGKPGSSPNNCTGNPGQGSFNIFASEFGGSRDRSRSWGGSRSCRNNEGRYDSPSINFNCESISSSSASVYNNSDLVGQDRQVPTFENGDGSCPSSWWSSGSGGGGWGW